MALAYDPRRIALVLALVLLHSKPSTVTASPASTPIPPLRGTILHRIHVFPSQLPTYLSRLLLLCVPLSLHVVLSPPQLLSEYSSLNEIVIATRKRSPRWR
ncbi:hypothetical protein C8R47DRAFT_457059 [Mycena vitilis]|nr:hypothetical protein C8R47DRAFT_457059 [Mycena vitilis]